ncbi:hypothetical protein C8R46DRAFT_1252382, partial [Mycena filopes]
MSFLKLLCIFFTTLGLHVASTSPNPPLKPAQQSSSSLSPRPCASFRRLVFSKALTDAALTAIQVFYWFAAFAEAVMAMAQLKSPSLSQAAILSTFTLGGNPPTTRLTAPLAVGSLLIICGALLRLQCYHALGKHFTFEMGITHNHRLITTGPYNYVRHPSYTGAVLAYFGLLMYYCSPGSWFRECVFKGSILGAVFCASYILGMSLVVAGLLARIAKEDEGLKREFGAEWDMWAVRVPFVLVPGIY